jgi:HNH endonuclease
MRCNELPTKSQVFEHWKDRFEHIGIWIDWDEPSCWACGFHYDGKYDIKRSDASWEQICRGWERIPLQLCHIVPRSCGGSDGPDNLFLMCRECHDLAPDTPIAEVFFEWARSQSWSKRETAKIHTALQSFGVADSDHAKLDEVICSEAFRSWARNKIGLHWPQSNYAPRSSRLKPATMVGLAVYYLRNFPALHSSHNDVVSPKRSSRS